MAQQDMFKSKDSEQSGAKIAMFHSFSWVSQDLITVIRQRAYKKRAVVTLRWRFPGGLELAVGLYQLLAIARKGAGTSLEARNNMPLKSEAAYIDLDTGMLLFYRVLY